MAQDGRVASLELPAELWHRILRCGSVFHRNDLKSLSLVCRLFANICQQSLFQGLAANADAGVVYKDPYFGHKRNPKPWRPPGTKRWPLQEWKWKEWEQSLRRTIISERRLALIGNHGSLALQPRKLTVRGYERGRDAYPADPFHPPPDGQTLSRAVYDALHSFRRTLLAQLPAFRNLRRLELFKYPVDNELLAALDSHSSLTELRFDFCWFPETTSPLTSITTLAFGHIPGSHVQPWDLSQDPYRNIPDHHVASAFDLISPPHIKHLDIELGKEDDHSESVFRELCARTSAKGQFRHLQSLSWSFYTRRESPIPIAMFLQFLARTPVLRKLNIQGRPPRLSLQEPIPLLHMPLLEILISPLEWARALVPGRPIKELRVRLQEDEKAPKFLAPSEAELEDFLRFVTLSTAEVTVLHLPVFPAVAPVWLMLPYITSSFPFLCDLKFAVAGDNMTERPRQFRCGTRSGPALPCIDTSAQRVEEGLLEMLERDLRSAVEEMLTGNSENRKLILSPVLDRVMAFRGIAEEEASEDERVATHPQPTVPSRGVQPPQPSTAKQPLQENLPPPPPEGSSLTPLETYFGESHNGVPPSQPMTSLDVLFLLARGHYTLPSTIQTLTLFSCFAKIPPTRYSRTATSGGSHQPSKPREDYQLCTKAVLLELAQRYEELAVVDYSDSIWGGSVESYRKGFGQWQHTSGYDRIAFV